MAATALLHAAPAPAQTESNVFEQFRHDRWMVYEGAPTGMQMIRQTPDGWIWIAAADGLVRFDGMSFERIPVAAGSPLERASAGPLLVTRAGELWVGYNQHGGVAVYRGGELHPLPMPKRPTSIMSLAQTRDGAIWAASKLYNGDSVRLYRFANGRWVDADARFGLAGGYPSDLCVTPDGTLWLTLFDQGKGFLTYLRPGSGRFEASPYPVVGGGCFVDRQGRLWVRGRQGLTMLAGADGRQVARPVPLYPDQESSLWPKALDSTGGVWGWKKDAIYFAPSGLNAAAGARAPVGRFSVADGLSSDTFSYLYVDRDDNVWVATELGLDRFRRAAAVPDRSIQGMFSNGLGLSQNGAELFIDATEGMYQVSPGQPRRVGDGSLTGHCPARGKGVWMIEDARIVRLQDGRQMAVPLPAERGLTSACAEDRLGRLWLESLAGRLWWRDATGWHTPEPPYPKPNWWDLVPTANGDIAYTSGTDLVRIVGDRLFVTPLAPYDPGMITNISAGGEDLFVSGSNGLLRIRGNRISRIGWRRFPWVARLRDLLQTPAGDTWMMRAFFTSRVSTADLNRAFDDPNAPLNRVVLDLRDGIRPPQSNDFTGRQMGFGADGRVWQLTRYGATVIDPALLARKAPPPVMIRALTSLGTGYRDPTALTLPPGSRAFDIDYTALSYAYPERLRFRYRLEGVDVGWIDAGTRRLASYANLGPGRYRFRVTASDNQRDWSVPGAVLDIEIRPTFLQSLAFKLICAVLLFCFLWLAYSLRMRAVANRIQLRMADRMAERERIARELHDTLLQGIQGLMLRFQTIADRISDPVTRQMLDETLDGADAVVIEGRDRVRDLRCSPDTGELAHKIDALAETVIDEYGSDIRLAVAGEHHPLHGVVTTEALRIAEEAIRNAVRHAAADAISLDIDYGSKQFALRISDNGVGISGEILAAGLRPGHYGLVGMKERAERIGGKLTIMSRQGQGTDVVLTVPAHAAYIDRRRGIFHRVRAKLVGRTMQ